MVMESILAEFRGPAGLDIDGIARGSRRALGSFEQAPQLHAGRLMSLQSSCVKTIQLVYGNI